LNFEFGSFEFVSNLIFGAFEFVSNLAPIVIGVELRASANAVYGEIAFGGLIGGVQTKKTCGFATIAL
jgi:hypothetical protein